MQNYSIDIIEHLYKANDTFVRPGDVRKAEIRRDNQGEAMTYLRLLTHVTQLSMDQGAILPKQYEQITEKIYEAMNLLGAWIKSDEKRYGGRYTGHLRHGHTYRLRKNIFSKFVLTHAKREDY